MKPSELKAHIQQLLKDAGYYDGAIDSDFGIKTYAALNALDLDVDDTVPVDEHPSDDVHRVKMSSFADPADIQGFRRCKDKGYSDNFCFSYGDNGLGFGGLTDCTDSETPYVALPRDFWMEKFGDAKKAVRAKILVTINGQTKECVLGDTMPWLRNIHNGAGLDMAVGAQKLFGLKPPFMVTGTWKWV